MHVRADGEKNFQRGRTDTFIVRELDLGAIESVTISHDEHRYCSADSHTLTHAHHNMESATISDDEHRYCSADSHTNTHMLLHSTAQRNGNDVMCPHSNFVMCMPRSSFNERFDSHTHTPRFSHALHKQMATM